MLSPLIEIQPAAVSGKSCIYGRSTPIWSAAVCSCPTAERAENGDPQRSGADCPGPPGYQAPPTHAHTAISTTAAAKIRTSTIHCLAVSAELDGRVGASDSAATRQCDSPRSFALICRQLQARCPCAVRSHWQTRRWREESLVIVAGSVVAADVILSPSSVRPVADRGSSCRGLNIKVMARFSWFCAGRSCDGSAGRATAIGTIVLGCAKQTRCRILFRFMH
jgi:hypothetical protein